MFKIFFLLSLFFETLIAEDNTNNLVQDILEDAEAAQNKNFENKPYVEIQFVDKYTGKFSTLVCKVGDTVQHHSLSIKIDTCLSSGPFDRPETKVFLEVEEPDISDDPIFKGWMIASVPAISTLEHRRYGLWIQKCVDRPVILE